MADEEDSPFETMRLKVLREVDEIRNDMQKDISDLRTEVSNDVTEVKNDVKNLKWIFGIALAALFAIFSTMLGVMAYLGNIF